MNAREKEIFDRILATVKAEKIDKPHAFGVARNVKKPDLYIVGVAIKGEKFRPLGINENHFISHDDSNHLMNFCEKLNQELGLSLEQANAIILEGQAQTLKLDEVSGHKFTDGRLGDYIYCNIEKRKNLN